MNQIPATLPDELTHEDLLELQLNNDFLLPRFDPHFTIEDLLLPFRTVSGLLRDFYFNACVRHVMQEMQVSMDEALTEVKKGIAKQRFQERKFR